MAVQQFFHGLAAGAGGVEHQAVIVRLQQRHHLLHAGRGHAEHADADGGTAVVVLGRAVGLAERAANGAGGIGQHAARDAVQPGHVGDGVHHGDVGRPDIGRDVAGSHGRHHQLGHADGQRAHGRRDQRRAARAAQAQQRADAGVGGGVALEGQRHGGDGRATVASEHRLRAARMTGGHLAGLHAGGAGRAGGGHVHRHHVQTVARQQAGHVFGLMALGVVGGGHVDPPLGIRHDSPAGGYTRCAPRYVPGRARLVEFVNETKESY